MPSTATSSHSVAPLAASAKIPVHSPSRSPSWSNTSRPCQPLATSRSGNVTALSLLAPAPIASHGWHRTTPKPSNSTLYDPSLRPADEVGSADR